jgi:hypothetical protein
MVTGVLRPLVPVPVPMTSRQRAGRVVGWIAAPTVWPTICSKRRPCWSGVPWM